MIFQILTEIQKQGHFSHQKNQSFQNLVSDFENPHFLDPSKGSLAFFGHIMVFFSAGSNLITFFYQILCMTQIWEVNEKF